MTQIPRIISVDDHVVEPPDLWSSRLPAKYEQRGPRIVREKGSYDVAKTGLVWTAHDAGEWADVWHYDGIVSPLMKLSAAAGFDELGFGAVTFDQIRPGCWQQKERLADMDANHMDASICFPNTLPRFCGQTFAERDDKDLALLCVRAYNDWMIDEWCAGDGKGRLIPLAMVPLWDPQLAADEVRRCAADGLPRHHVLGEPASPGPAIDPFG